MVYYLFNYLCHSKIIVIYLFNVGNNILIFLSEVKFIYTYTHDIYTYIYIFFIVYNIYIYLYAEIKNIGDRS